MSLQGLHILFIQLPLINHGYDYIYGNMEYAPASLAGFVQAIAGEKTEVHLLPRYLSLFASDSKIVSYVDEIKPDIVCFTVYSWNAERSTLLARTIKNRHSRCRFFFGGPEIAHGSSIFDQYHPAIDYFVSGEGEWFFRTYLLNKNLPGYCTDVNKNNIINQPNNELISLNETCEPLTGAILSPMPDGSNCIEMTRGCPYKCAYCYYSKNCPGIRERDFSFLHQALEMDGITELYILSPTFDRSRDFHDRLRDLARINRGVSLHTELRAGNIDKDTAELLYRAGFRSLEVGLQTMNRKALKKAGRTGDPEKELAGMRTLFNAGIDLKIGIIPGLPGDTPEEFMQTIDRLTEEGLGDCIELYPLMVLPGTAMRDMALDREAHFLKKPPYYFQYGWGFEAQDIKSIISHAEEKTGFSHIQPALPDCTQNHTGMLTRGIHLCDEKAEMWHESYWAQHVETNVFSFFIHLTDPKKMYLVLPHLLQCMDRQELFNIIITGDALLNEDTVLSFIEEHKQDTFYRRLHFFDLWKLGLSVRFYQFFEDYAAFARAAEQYRLIEPGVRLTNQNLALCEQHGANEYGVLVPEGMYAAARDYLLSRYAEDTAMAAFENESEQKQFYDDLGQEYVELPWSMRVR